MNPVSQTEFFNCLEKNKEDKQWLYRKTPCSNVFVIKDRKTHCFFFYTVNRQLEELFLDCGLIPQKSFFSQSSSKTNSILEPAVFWSLKEAKMALKNWQSLNKDVEFKLAFSAKKTMKVSEIDFDQLSKLSVYGWGDYFSLSGHHGQWKVLVSPKNVYVDSKSIALICWAKKHKIVGTSKTPFVASNRVPKLFKTRRQASDHLYKALSKSKVPQSFDFWWKD